MKKNMLVAAMVAGCMAAAGLVASAKEITSGGTIGGVTTCSPIKGVTAKGDARVGELGIASVQMGWSVAPCDKAQAVRVVASITEWQSKTVLYTDIDAGLSGKLVLAVAPRFSYACTVSVYDAATGVLLDTSTVFASTTPKGV